MSSGASTYGYDDEGQLIDADGASLTFDAAHRLVATGGTDPCQYLYDGKDNRLQATRNGQITRYIYSASGQLLAEADGSNTIQRYYIYGKGLTAMVTAGGETYCYHFDASANAIALTDSGESVVNAYAYTPFGQIANEMEATDQPFRFAAQFGVMTEPNGLYYMKARYYDSEVGRFISEDPLGFEGGSLNLYVYAANNPIMFMDPKGLCKSTWDKVGDILWENLKATPGRMLAQLVDAFYWPSRNPEQAILFMLGGELASVSGGSNITNQVIRRTSLGADSGESLHIIERMNGEAI